jgi:uncharacterized membrane protein
MMRFGALGYRGFGGGMGLLTGVCAVLGSLLLIGLIMMIVRALVWGPRYHRMGCGMHRMAGHEPEEDEALQVLRRRFAAGEIAKEEYEEKLKVLKS